MLSLVLGDGRDIGSRLSKGLVELFLVALEGLDQVGYGPRPEQAGEEDDDADPRAGPGRVGRDDGAGLGQLGRPDVGVPPLVARSSFRLSRLVAVSMGGTGAS
jgi:hypothetical protein